jgi:protein TonB
MFTTLVESRPSRARRFGGTVASALIHGALIGGAVMLTLPDGAGARPAPTEPDKPPVFVPIGKAPITPRPPRPGPPLTAAPPQAPDVDIRIPLPDWNRPIRYEPGQVDATDDIELGGRGVAAPDLMGLGAMTAPGGDGRAWEANQVDRSPALAGHAIEPRYPAQLRAAGLEGRAVIQFVVDTLGRAEPASVTVMETAHPLFAEAVREVLPRYRFTPGEAAGHKVRTRVQIPFDFTIKR